MSLSKRTRFEVFKRDLFTCCYCGRRPPDTILQVDHVIARASGGTDDAENLATSCVDCNQGKSDKSLGSISPAVDEFARLEAMQEMAERALLVKQHGAVIQAKRQAEIEAVDLVLRWWTDIGGTGESFQNRSVVVFLSKLTLDEIYESIEATGRKWDQVDRMKTFEAWRYFCGCCWTLIKKPKAAE